MINNELIVSRIKKLMDENKLTPSSFAKKILSSNELEIASQYKNDKLVKYLAKQFAAKEAISKAFGTGLRKPILMKDIEIMRDTIGKPYLNPLAGVKKTIIDLGITKSHVSLADESEYVIAFAILEL